MLDSHVQRVCPFHFEWPITRITSNKPPLFFCFGHGTCPDLHLQGLFFLPAREITLQIQTCTSKCLRFLWLKFPLSLNMNTYFSISVLSLHFLTAFLHSMCNVQKQRQSWNCRVPLTDTDILKKKKKRIAFHWDKSLDVRASLFQWWTYWGFFSLCCLGLWHQEKLQYKKDTACVLRVITVTGGCAPCGQQGHCVVF